MDLRSVLTNPYSINRNESGDKWFDFPYTEEPIWILGKKYSYLYDIDAIRADIRSKIWFTYRKDFPAIGGTKYTSDKHWGCMLRCGQMVLAQALVYRHLGRGWLWSHDTPDPVYLHILRMFQDRKDCTYAIHQIVHMGIHENKKVGQWYGPNTIAQVFRKLAVFDDWSSIVVHVALDNTVIIDDVKKLSMFSSSFCKNCTCGQHQSSLPSSKYSQDAASGSTPVAQTDTSHKKSRCLSRWKPVLLFIPLRLGLSSFNSIYTRSLKATFMFRQTLGIIGGEPGHALYFIGVVGNELVYLDPHKTQTAVPLDSDHPNDSSYHIPYGTSGRMAINNLDPSISLCFFFESEDDFDTWCNQAQNILIFPEKQPLFELAEQRPSHWPPLELEPIPAKTLSASCVQDFTFLDGKSDSEEEFEIISEYG